MTDRQTTGHAPQSSPTIDLNADLGEEITDDDALMTIVTSANVACGGHAGTVAIMRRVCDLAVERGVAVGAQVSYVDRANFGRIVHDVAPDVLRQQVSDQIGVLGEVAVAAGTQVAYVKPHGALYHRVLDDADQAHAVLSGSGQLPVLTMRGVMAALAADAGRVVRWEGFADRRLLADGRLMPREIPGSVVSTTEEIVEQALAVSSRVDSVCVHGDTPGAVDHARAVRRALLAHGVALRPFAGPTSSTG